MVSSTQESNNNSSKRFTLGEDKRSIMDTETGKKAVFKESILSEDISDYCEYLNEGTLKVERIKWI